MSMIAGIARSQVKRVLQDGKGSRGVDGVDGATTENPTAGLVGHADGLEAGSNPSSSSSFSSSFSPSRGKHSLGASGPSGGGGGDADGGDDAAAAQGKLRGPPAAIPNYSGREEQVVRLSKRLLNVFYFCGTIFAAIILWQLITLHKERHVIAWSVGAIFVGVAIPFSLHDIHMHTLHYVNPLLQKYYIRILWMVPIYAIESWLALRFRGQKLFLETAREAYEAYVIYNFYMLLLHYLGGGRAVRDILKAKSDAGRKFVYLIFPFCCLKWKRSGQFINRCTVGVFQYVIIRFFLAFVTCGVEYMLANDLGNEKALHRTVLAIIIIINASQIWAMYCLVLFYHEFAHELRALSPFWKFVVVKTVVFLSFWQGLGIAGLAEEGLIASYMDYSKADVASGIQDFLICVEMAGISIAHKYVFSYKDMQIIMKPEEMVPLSPWQAWWDILPWDTMTDFREQIVNGFGIVHKFQKRAAARSPCNKNSQQGIIGQSAVAAAAALPGAGGAGGATQEAGLP